MKILLVTDAYTHLTSGVATVVATLSDAYRTKGHDVKVLTISGDIHSHREDNAYYMPSFRVPLYPDVRFSLARRHPYLAELIGWKPEIVHIHTEGSTMRMAKMIARECDAPFVMTWHTDYAKFAFHKHYALDIIRVTAKMLMSKLYRGAKVITVPSYKAKHILDGYSVKIPNIVIPNGINLGRFYQDFSDEERVQLLREYGVPENRRVLVIVSRLSPEKNLSELIEYYPSLLDRDPSLHLVIAGIGPDKKHLEHLCERLGIEEHVTFVGFVQPEDTYRCYKLGLAFLSASTFEMHSMTYLEAMACGLPLICRDDPCLQGVLTDGVNGCVYRTQEEFVDKAMALLSDEELRRKMGENSLTISRQFSEEAFSDNMLALYEQVISDTFSEDTAQSA